MNRKENQKQTGKSRKKIKIAVCMILILVSVVIAGGVIFSIQVGKQVAEGLLYQNEGNDTKNNSLKQLKLWEFDLEGFEGQYVPELVSVKAEDGTLSPGAVFDTDRKQTAILIHGLGGDHVCMYPVAELYLENGWDVISIDQRASGNSENDQVSFGYYEKLDVAAWVDYAKNEMDSERIVVHGQSMGAATAALYAATDHAQQTIEAVILDSCFDSMENMFLGVWREMEGTEGIPEDYILACGDWYLKHQYGFGFADTDVMEQMKENHVKTLMIQCSRDDIVSNETAQKMFENIVAKEKKICYFDSKHIEALIDDRETYQEEVFSFLNS